MDNVITIRNMSADDVPLVFEWRNDLRIRKYMFNSDPIEPDGHAKWFDKTHKNPSRHLLLVCRGAQPFGFVQFNVSECGKVGDWGFYVDPNGPKGQGETLGHNVLNFGFNSLGLHRIWAQVLAENTKSLAFHTKLGFTQEGVLRSHHFSADGYQEVHLFGLLIKEWENVKNNTIRLAEE